eukprot:gene2889-3178_t
MAEVLAAVEVYPVVKSIITDLVGLFTGANDHEREEWIKGLVGQLAQQYPGFNVLVFKSGHFTEGPEDVQVQTETRYADSNFTIMVFGSGKFVRDGDGGFINWCFMGKFDRCDNEVTFYDQQS